MNGSGIFLALVVAQTVAAPGVAKDAAVIRLEPALDELITPDAKLQELLERQTIFEGPTWVRKAGSGHLIFSDVPGNVINRLDPDGKVTPVVHKIFRGTREPFQSTGQKQYRMIGANGTTVDDHGRLVYCEFSDGEIVRVEPDGQRTILASSFEGRRLNAPNDLVYGPDGSLYFTDSRAGHGADEVPHKGLYILRAGNVQLLSSKIDHPNGVAFSPDAKYLYVTDTWLKKVLRFRIQARGVKNEEIFADMSGDTKAGGPDGIKVDVRGNVYATGPGGIWILSPSGKHIGTIPTPEVSTNLTFGGADFKTLYITTMGAVYRISLRTAALRGR